MQRTRPTPAVLFFLVASGFVGCSNTPGNESTRVASCSNVRERCDCSSSDACDASYCSLPGESCADKVIGDLIQTGQAYVQLPTPYGQNCQGQGVIEVSESSFGVSTGLFVSSTWDQAQTNAPCESRRSQFSVWVKLDNGSSDAGQDSWTLYDRISVAGVVPASLPDKCMTQSQCRIKGLPESMSALCDSPVSYVDLNRKSALGRVTSVKVVAQASSNCEALPLEFLVSPDAE